MCTVTAGFQIKGPHLVVGGRWVISRGRRGRGRWWSRCMVEAGTNMSMSMTTMVRYGKEHRREEQKKLRWTKYDHRQSWF